VREFATQFVQIRNVGLRGIHFKWLSYKRSGKQFYERPANFISIKRFRSPSSVFPATILQVYISKPSSIHDPKFSSHFEMISIYQFPSCPPGLPHAASILQLRFYPQDLHHPPHPLSILCISFNHQYPTHPQDLLLLFVCFFQIRLNHTRLSLLKMVL
jgi:hypothetical protein